MCPLTMLTLFFILIFYHKKHLLKVEEEKKPLKKTGSLRIEIVRSSYRNIFLQN
jgi:hypothetical protein